LTEQNNPHYPNLFEPLALTGGRLKNRIIHASMTTRYGANQAASERFIDYHRSRAQGGAAMLITEPFSLLPWHNIGYKPNPNTKAGFDSLCRLAEAVESLDCRILGQIQDSGRGRHEQGRHPNAFGASALPDDLSWTVPHVLSTVAVWQLIDDVVTGCERIKAAGMSGVEISAGHGHLFHQFLSTWSNQRDDEFGGSLENRVRLVKTMAARIRDACGKDFIISLKLPGDDGVADSIDCIEAGKITAALADPEVVSLFSFAQGSHAPSLYMHIPDMTGPRAPYTELGLTLKKSAGTIPVMALGLITDPAEAEGLLSAGFDLIGLGRPLVTDAAWPRKAETGLAAGIRYCVSCNTCWATIVQDHAPIACDNNPRVGLPGEGRPLARLPNKDAKRIVVVGSGVAGLEAAHTAAERGHTVTVLGAGAEVGGKLRLRVELPGGENLSSVYDYQLYALQAEGVKIELGFHASVSDVMGYDPDAVIVATGSTMAWPRELDSSLQDDGIVPDLREAVVALADFGGAEDGTAVILDRDHTWGTYAAAERFRQIFSRVIIVTPRERLAEEEALVTRQVINKRLSMAGVEWLLHSEALGDSPLDEGVLKVANIFTGAQQTIDDLALLTYATPRVPNNGLAVQLQAEGVECYLIGDAYAPRTLMAATSQGFQIGSQV
jgi:2,4-dienoyl-CoA reductase-like NADH-dependent reductase (Old Yellow Enzyme family)/thioredoxin reductase